ncbi:MAG: aldo/keto reductase [Candidatus Tectomicrobia bacterium]|nr:aldo/keto reductase [Candidatus Tectomicrobia bacterium]
MSASPDHRPAHPNRRTLLKGLLHGSAVLGAAPALLYTAQSARAAAAEPSIKQYKPLGSTDMRIADVSFGASRLRDDPDLVRHALDRGINYFDTAESYTGGTSEETIGQALQGKRDKVFLTSKGAFSAHDSRDEMMQTLEGSLRRLRTDYIDVYFNHAVNEVGRLQNPEFYAFTERAKQQGKIRYVGLSGHGGRLIECLDYAIDRGAYDVMLVAYNFGQDPSFMQRFTRNFDFIAVNQELPRVIKKAKAAGMGVVAMKTLRGAKLNDMEPYQKDGATFAQAAFRWVLSNPAVDALIVTMNSPRQVNEYIAASGSTKLSRHDLELLDRYTELNDATYCRPVCDACAASCPVQVPIADVLRHKMYFEDYGAERMARERYTQLSTNASACLTCADQTCANACVYGLPIPQLTRQAHAKFQGAHHQ